MEVVWNSVLVLKSRRWHGESKDIFSIFAGAYDCGYRGRIFIEFIDGFLEISTIRYEEFVAYFQLKPG
jgi:hypothetical protein